MKAFEFSPIGFIHTPFQDKFGLPRQSGMAEEAKGVIKLNSDPDLKTALRTLEEFSHIWVVFVFHDQGSKKWKPSIRPPRFGGAKKVGVLASRSPHRPNPIGISALKLLNVDIEAAGGPELHVAGIDVLDQTPVLDIKPYIGYTDCIPNTRDGWAQEPIPRYEVRYSLEVEQQLLQIKLNDGVDLKPFIQSIVELDPRPAFQKRQLPVEDSKSWGTQYGFDIQGYEIKYTLDQGEFHITKIFKIED